MCIPTIPHDGQPTLPHACPGARMNRSRRSLGEHRGTPLPKGSGTSTGLTPQGCCIWGNSGLKTGWGCFEYYCWQLHTPGTDEKGQRLRESQD